MSFSGDDSTRARGLRRAQLVASVSHPNLVRLVPRSAGGYSCALDGAQRLSHFSGSSPPFRRFELEHAVRLLLDVLNGLDALHELVIDGRPFVHGYVSPEHICVDAHGQARLLPLAHPHVTVEAGSKLNGYAAPEWLLGSELDRRADLFSVGVLLWEALAGRRLFPEPSAAVVLARLASGPLPPPTLPAGADWARGLCLVAERALAAEPAHRPASALELSRSILAAGGHRLTRPLGDDWHDAAPTLPAPRRPQPAPRRTFSPPGVVIDLLLEPKREENPPVMVRGLAPAPALSQPVGTLAPSPAAASPVAASWPRAPSPPAPLRPWLLGAMAATYLALIGWLQAQRSAPPVGVQAPTTPAAAAPAPGLAAPALSAPAAASTSVGVPAASTRPASSPVAPAKSAAPLRSRRAAPARRLPASAEPEPERIDYGI